MKIKITNSKTHKKTVFCIGIVLHYKTFLYFQTLSTNLLSSLFNFIIKDLIVYFSYAKLVAIVKF